jgi:hypothetical protein
MLAKAMKAELRSQEVKTNKRCGLRGRSVMEQGAPRSVLEFSLETNMNKGGGSGLDPDILVFINRT